MSDIGKDRTTVEPRRARNAAESEVAADELAASAETLSPPDISPAVERSSAQSVILVVSPA